MTHPDLTAAEADRFWAKAETADPDGCWNWTAYRNPAGYGKFRFGPRNAQRTDYAHRIAYRLARGPIPEGFVIDHLCRNKSCINPRHLDAAPQRENVRRGKHAIVDAAQVREIRRLHHEERMPRAEIARRFGLSATGAFEVIHRLTWQDVD